MPFSDTTIALDTPAATPSLPPHPDMLWIPGGTFQMGSDRHYPEERPVHRVKVSGFWMDRTPVTNAQFRRFVDETSYVTYAEIAPRAADYPGARPEMLRPGSMVFVKPPQRVDVRNCHNWWEFRLGADWRHPYGPDSSLDGLDDHPVVHVSVADAEAYAAWAGKSLPTESEWERAARGGAEGMPYAWGSEFLPAGRHMANTWQGHFPWQNLATDGYEATSPVGTYPPNGYGLVDMIGNVWEWTTDWFMPRHPADAVKACCIPLDPRGGLESDSHDPANPIRIPRRVLKGGSHLCAPNYCRRYRPAARFAHPVDTSTCHIGMRFVVRPSRT